MFQTAFPSITRSSKLHIQRQVFVRPIPDAVCAVLSSWWWTEKPSETCRASYRNKLWNVASSWLYSANSGNFLRHVKWYHLLTYSMVRSPSWEANWLAASQEIPRISRNPKVHYRTHKRACECFLTWMFYREGLLAPRPTPKLEDHSLSTVRDCSFNLFAATLPIGGRSSIRNLRTRHAVVTGTHYMEIKPLSTQFAEADRFWLRKKRTETQVVSQVKRRMAYNCTCSS